MKIPVLLYHRINNKGINEKYNLSLYRFKDQINSLLKQKSAYRHIITFDDGFSCFYHHAFPILKGKDLEIILFLITEKIGDRGFLTWNQVSELNRCGISIQSHTKNHFFLPRLSKSELIRELQDSKRTIEDRLSKEVKYLSLPYGGKSSLILETARQVGYVKVFTSDIRFAKLEAFEIPRINIPGYISEDKFIKIIQVDCSVLFPYRACQLLKNLIKLIIGYKRVSKF